MLQFAAQRCILVLLATLRFQVANTVLNFLAPSFEKALQKWQKKNVYIFFCYGYGMPKWFQAGDFDKFSTWLLSKDKI